MGTTKTTVGFNFGVGEAFSEFCDDENQENEIVSFDRETSVFELPLDEEQTKVLLHRFAEQIAERIRNSIEPAIEADDE